MLGMLIRSGARALAVGTVGTGLFLIANGQPRFAYCKVVDEVRKSKLVAQQITGKWNLVESDNFDAFMKEVGVGYLKRTLAGKTRPQLTIVQEGDTWSITSVSSVSTHVIKFELGNLVDMKTIDGREVVSKFYVEGDKLVQEEKAKDGVASPSRYTRYIESGKLKIICECNGVKATRVYDKA